MSSRRYEIALLVLACGLAVIASTANAVEPRDDDLTMDFEAKPWLHHGSTDFGAARLEGYVYTGSFSPGRFFTMALDWADTRMPIPNAALSLVAPSRPAFGLPQPQASVHVSIREGVNNETLDVPDVLTPGMYFISVAVPDKTGRPRAVYLRPIFVSRTSTEPSAPLWAGIADEIALRTVTAKHDQPDTLTIAFDWAALKPIAANYAVSLRLQDDNGHVWVSLDTQPGYGFLPTSAWRPGENQHDVYTLTLPPDMPRDVAYALDVVWYRVASQEEIGRVRVPGIQVETLYDETEVPPPAHTFIAPPMQQRVDATFGDVIRLLGYDMSQLGSRLTLTLHWQALADIDADYKFFVHVFDPDSEAIVAQVDAMPGGNAYPTSRWVKGEVVSERVEIEVDAAPGTYRVATGWYEPVSADRLSAVGDKSNPLPENRVLIVEEVSIP